MSDGPAPEGGEMLPRGTTPWVPRRTVVQAEALSWLSQNPAPAGASVVTSLPDVSELPSLGLEAWKAWFVGAARQIIAWLPEGAVAVFFQSDVLHRGAWVDKGHLVASAVDAERAHLVWHKIVCRKPPGTVSFGRATYSHMLCVSRRPRRPPRRPGPDVLPDAGFMPWSRAMGANACRVACRFVLDETDSTLVVDPFCGQGTALAVANDLGLDSLGVELSAKRCKAARGLVLAEVTRR